MSIFEQLFVSLCQACGMIPYTIKDNLITNKFSRFTFSYRNFTTWWFIFIFFLHPATMFVLFYMSKDADDSHRGRDVPATVHILLAVTAISYIVELILSRWIVSRYRKLRNVIETIQEVEKLLGEKFLSQHRTNSVTVQFVIGFILVVTSVSLTVMNLNIYDNNRVLLMPIKLHL